MCVFHLFVLAAVTAPPPAFVILSRASPGSNKWYRSDGLPEEEALVVVRRRGRRRVIQSITPEAEET